MISIRGVWSQEANTEAEKLIMSNMNVLDANGLNVRNIGNESVQTIYVLTRD